MFQWISRQAYVLLLPGKSDKVQHMTIVLDFTRSGQSHGKKESTTDPMEMESVQDRWTPFADVLAPQLNGCTRACILPINLGIDLWSTLSSTYISHHP
jgi:hypothetical protein